MAKPQPRSVKMTRRGQLTIPKRFREELNWEEGDEFLAIPEAGGSIRVVPLGQAADALLEKMDKDETWYSEKEVFDA